MLTAGAAVLTVAVGSPWLDSDLGQPSVFIPTMLALVGCFDILSVALLVIQFRDTGHVRTLVLSWAFVFSLVGMLGWAAAFPGVFGTTGPLATVASTAPWLWVVWHTGFPALLALALGPWPVVVPRKVAPGRRRLVMWATVTAMVGLSALLVAAVAAVAPRLPVIISGTDTSAMTRVTGPVVLPVVVVATAICMVFAWRRGGVARWAGLAAAAALGDVILTLFSYHRFGVGWYAGRTLTIVSAGVVLVALLAEFCDVSRRLSVEGQRLCRQLEKTGRLERLQHTLLAHMSEGVLMQTPTGHVVASNQAARDMLSLTTDEVQGSTALDARLRALFADGTAWGTRETPPRATLRTGVAHRHVIMGMQAPEESARWLSINTEAVRHPAGTVDHVVSTFSDVTEEHAAALAAEQDHRARRDRITQVLDRGGPTMVFQPIVELGSGKAVGVEGLARFDGEPQCPPDAWFADAADVGLGVELELSAIRVALTHLDQLPAPAYMSLNVSPATLAAPELREMLRSSPCSRLILELTEQTIVEDYEAISDVLDDLRALGTGLAVDDTGAGFASLQRIINLRPEVIKLDRALVAGIDADPARRALAGALLTFARDIGATVVAEGIENAREKTVLRRLGLRYGQGFHLGRPGVLPLAEHVQAGKGSEPVAVTA